MNNVTQQFEFILEIDKLKAVYRQTRVQSDNARAENSAEHSWHIALAAQVLAEHALDKINIDRVIKMLLIHDVIEIDAGDLFAFAAASDHKLQAKKELAAAQRLFSLLPEAQYQKMQALWIEFEDAITADARFAKSIDRILPVLLNMAAEGGSWVTHKVHAQQVLTRNQLLEKSAPKLWEHVRLQVEIAVKNGWLIAG
ncbi:metal dependent phosphohydrolase [Psychromonas sp. CNPT3]|uniref:HD domain-containing protein n=1 Tax=Psychromonas sp. CNPT3 TaxID=314282 RepID=UPI00006E8ABE|nr:HD domain-containing protein [Psychromonas sp. CNPT3]AGH80520.1 metal dependent phosphohydrolase [Psychromonas sp. CNPT3]